jgi:serine/threonine protein phosphatase 1
MGKIFVIGDIHGLLFKLKVLMAKLDMDVEKDTLIFLGDYIDRGQDSKGVIDAILKIRQTVKQVICLRGNHEQMFINYYGENKDEELFMHNGGMKTLISYGFERTGGRKTLRIPESHREFFTTLPIYHETDDYIFVHAGLRPGVPLDQQNPEDLLWIRDTFIDSPRDFGKIVVFGHTPVSFDRPFIEHNKIGVDTGAIYGGKLTCLELTDMKMYQV